MGFLQEVEWPVDNKGLVIGNGCTPCTSAMTKGACKDWVEGMQIYQDSTHPEHNMVVKIVDACCATLAQMAEGNEVTFHPQGLVDSQAKQGVMHYTDLAFMSDEDLVKHCGLGLKALGFSEHAVHKSQRTAFRDSEDGSGLVEGIYVSFQDLDLPFHDIMSLRKTRIWSEACVRDGSYFFFGSLPGNFAMLSPKEFPLENSTN